MQIRVIPAARAVHRLCRFVVCLTGVGLLGVVPVIGYSQTAEPPQTFNLLVNGTKHAIRANRAIELELEGKTSIELVPDPNRRFRYAGLDISYPSNFAFEADLDEDGYNWNLDGSDVVIMIFAFPGERFGHKSFAQSIGSNYEGTTYKPVSNSFGAGDQAKTFKGTYIDATVATTKLSQEVYRIPTTGGTRFLIIQDSLTDDGDHTKEYRDTLKLLKNELKIEDEKIPAIAH